MTPWPDCRNTELRLVGRAIVVVTVGSDVIDVVADGCPRRHRPVSDQYRVHDCRCIRRHGGRWAVKLEDFSIGDAEIHGIGPDTKAMLGASGYRTAADFTGGGVHRVWNGYGHEEIPYLIDRRGDERQIPGVGVVRLKALLAWREAVRDYVRGGKSQGEVEFDARWRALQHRAQLVFGEVAGMVGPRTFSTATEMHEFRDRLRDLRREIAALPCECRRVLRDLKASHPGWRRHPSVSVSVRVAEAMLSEWTQTVGSLSWQLDFWIKELTRKSKELSRVERLARER